MTLQDGIATDEMSDDKRRRRKRWRRKRMMMRRREKKKTKERLGTASHSAALTLMTMMETSFCSGTKANPFCRYTDRLLIIGRACWKGTLG